MKEEKGIMGGEEGDVREKKKAAERKEGGRGRGEGRKRRTGRRG